jgi:hypothetical protein
MIIYNQITSRTRSNATLRRTLNKIASEQDFTDFVDDIEFAIAGQIGYRLLGQILFYFGLRRKQPSLRSVHLSSQDKLPDALRTYWNDVRHFDYEALFKPEQTDDLVEISDHGQLLIRLLN